MSEAEIRQWLIDYLCDLLALRPEEIDVSDPVSAYGLDSSGALGIVGDLEQWLGFKLEDTLVYNYPTVEALARKLAEKAAQ
ncbi:MAG: acyl carrier protein [Myxococcota bacterium]